MSHRSIKLRRGEVQVVGLRQGLVYNGLLEGLPTKGMNRQIIEDLLAAERQSGAEPHLIVPVETPITSHRPYPPGEPASLPGVFCVARLQADHGERYSSLAVVWFQHDFAFPIDKTVLDQIACLDWAKLATTYEW